MTQRADDIVDELKALGRTEDAVAKAAYLQAKPGGYAEGDQFVGVRVPRIRELARAHRRAVNDADLKALLAHDIHEARLLGAILVVEIYKPSKTSQERRTELVQIVLDHTPHLNNWDLVDSVAPFTLGPWLLTQSAAQQDKCLDALASDQLIWKRRLAMVGTLGLIRAGELRQTFRIATHLLNDEEDLIHKAVGWMLREAGLRDRSALDAFLNQHAATMPRTALRYAIEKHAPAQRKHYLNQPHPVGND